MKKEDELDLLEVLYVLLKHRRRICVCAAVGLVIGIILSAVSYVRGEMSTEYAISSAIAVSSQTEGGLFAGRGDDPTKDDIYLAENMVDSVIYLLRSDKLLNAAVEHAGLEGISTQKIASKLKMEQYNGTQIIELTLRWKDAEEGEVILAAINAVAPAVLIDTLKIGSVTVVNDPVVRNVLGGQIHFNLIAICVLAGFAVASGISVLQMLLQPTLLKSRDMKDRFHLEILGEIPVNTAFFAEEKVLMGKEKTQTGNDVLEGFSSAAHILRHQMRKGDSRCIFVTSSAENEGKTSVTANLGVQLAELGHKVLLVDFDVRNPSLSGMFLKRVDYRSSLNALYRGESTPEEAIVALNRNLDLLPTLPEKQELSLDSSLLWKAREIGKDYDYVLMDAAPVGRVADTMNLNMIADRALFVVKHDTTSLADIQEALERLEKSGIQMIGCIINGVRKLSMERYSSNWYGYRRNRKAYAKKQDQDKVA